MQDLVDFADDAEASPKRRLVLDAAAALFMAHGYGAVSMDAVARAAGVSKATLYAHFASKDALFATIIGERCRLRLVQEPLVPVDAPDIRAALTHIGWRVVRFMHQPETLAIYRVVVAESGRFPELGRAFYENGPARTRTRFAEWIAEQARAGHLDVADPVAAADQFAALLRAGAFLRATLAMPPPPTEAELAATVTAAVAMFLAHYAAR